MKKIFSSPTMLKYGTALVLWCSMFSVYLLTMAPTVGFIDSGELATVSCTLGIGHPTGYPLFTLASHLFTLLPVADEPIIRLNIFAAILTATSAVLVYLAFFVLFSITKNRGRSEEQIFAAAYSTAALGFSKTFWSQGVSIEVYALHLLMLSLSLLTFLLAIEAEQSHNSHASRYWILFAFIVGLSFANHLTTVLLAPGLLYMYFAVNRFDRSSWKKIGVMSLPFLLGLSIYMYLPIRAGASPSLNWGNPVNLERFIWHVSGKQFRVWMFSSMDVAGKQLKYFFDTLTNEFTIVPLLLALYGVWTLLLSQRRMLLFITLLFGGCIAYAINYDIHDIDSYFLLAYIAAALFSGFGVVHLIRLSTRKYFVVIASIGLLSMFVYQVNQNWTDVDESKNYLVEDYTKAILLNLPPNALLLSYQWDYFVSASYYFQQVKNIRPDVVVIDKELLRRSWYFDQLNRSHPRLIQKSKYEIDAFLQELYKFEHELPYDPSVIENRYIGMIESFLDHNKGERPMYVTSEIEKNIAPGYNRIPEVFAFRLTRENSYYPIPLPRLSFRQIFGQDSYTNQLSSIARGMLLLRGNYEKHFNHDSLASLYLGKSLIFTSAVQTSKIP